jgi:hypothetical protein
MTKKLVLLILVLLSSEFYLSVRAQNTLVLGGKATNLKLIEEDSRSIAFEVELQLTLRNALLSPVILYWDEFLVVGEQLFTKTDKGVAELLHQTSGLPSTDLSPVWRGLRQKLNVSSPPDDLTRVLLGQQWIEIKRTIVLRFFKNRLDRATWDEIRTRSPLFLRVTLDLFPNNLDYIHNRTHENRFGKSLQSKWQRFGQLQINAVLSEPIQIEFPDS